MASWRYSLLAGAALLVVQVAGGPARAQEWPTLQGDPQRSGFVKETVEPPYKELWSAPMPGRLGDYAQPVVAGGKVVLATLNSAVFALDASTGKAAWTFRSKGPFLHSAAIEGTRVFAACHDGNLYALSLDDGKELWRFRAEAGFWASPCCAEGKVFIGCGDGNFYAIDQESGKQVWLYAAGEKVQQSAAYRDGKVTFGAEDGRAHLLEAATGKLLWKSQPLATLSFRYTWPVFTEAAVAYCPMTATNVPIYYGYDRDGKAIGWQSGHPSDVSKLPPKATDTDFIRAYLDQNPDRQSVYLLAVGTGKLMSTVPAFVFRTSPQPPPVLMPDGDLVLAHSGLFWGESAPAFLGRVHLGPEKAEIKDFLRGALGVGVTGPIRSGFPSDIPCQLTGCGQVLLVSCDSPGGYDFRTQKGYDLPKGSITNGIIPAEGKLFQVSGGRLICHAGQKGSQQ